MKYFIRICPRLPKSDEKEQLWEGFVLAHQCIKIENFWQRSFILLSMCNFRWQRPRRWYTTDSFKTAYVNLFQNTGNPILFPNIFLHALYGSAFYKSQIVFPNHQHFIVGAFQESISSLTASFTISFHIASASQAPWWRIAYPAARWELYCLNMISFVSTTRTVLEMRTQ